MKIFRTGFTIIITAISLISAPESLLARGNGWVSIGLSDQSVESLLTGPGNSPGIYAGTAQNGVFRSTDLGSTWSNVLGPGCPIAFLAADRQIPPNLFAMRTSACGSTPGGILRSTDGGDTWTGIISDDITALASDPVQESTLYAGTAQLTAGAMTGSVIKSTDGGSGWDWMISNAANFNVTGFSISPSTPFAVYATYTGQPLLDGGLIRSTDAGATWTAIPLPQTFNAFTSPVIAVDPSNSAGLLFAYYGSPSSSVGGLFRSTDGGTTWAQAGSGLAGVVVRAIAYDPRDSSRVFAGTNGGVFRSTDGGLTWQPASEGLATTDVKCLAFDITGTTLYAGTAAGIFVLTPSATFGCTTDAQTLCLNGARFQVQAQWTDFNGNSGFATVVPGATSNSSGVMWFFSPDNWELLIKVLDGCGVNYYHWVFAAAATNVQYTIQVTDTLTGQVNTYANPLGTVSPAITDSTAFGGACP